MSINKTIKTLGVAKSSIYYQSKAYPKRQKSVRKNLPEEVKAAILTITEKKSTYGTPRVRALLKRDHGMTVSKYMVNGFLA